MKGNNLPEDESLLKCIPGTIFLILLISSIIGYLCYKHIFLLIMAGIGAFLIWLFYW